MTEKPAPKTVKVKEPLSRIGGSKSDDWNLTLADQACQTLWTKNSSAETRDRQIEGVVAALIGINPGDEIEGMIAAQMIACHSAAMECYRRAMLPEQTFEGRNMGLNHGAKASRTYAALVEALSRHRGKGQQKMTVEHVHVHQGGQAIVGMVDRGGEAITRKRGTTPCKANCKCSCRPDVRPSRNGAGSRASRQP